MSSNYHNWIRNYKKKHHASHDQALRAYREYKHLPYPVFQLASSRQSKKSQPLQKLKSSGSIIDRNDSCSLQLKNQIDRLELILDKNYSQSIPITQSAPSIPIAPSMIAPVHVPTLLDTPLSIPFPNVKKIPGKIKVPQNVADVLRGNLQDPNKKVKLIINKNPAKKFAPVSTAMKKVDPNAIITARYIERPEGEKIVYSGRSIADMLESSDPNNTKDLSGNDLASALQRHFRDLKKKKLAAAGLRKHKRRVKFY